MMATVLAVLTALLVLGVVVGYETIHDGLRGGGRSEVLQGKKETSTTTSLFGEDSSFWDRALFIDEAMVSLTPTRAPSERPVTVTPTTPAPTGEAIVEADFSAASPTNIVLLESIIEASDAVVEVTSPIDASIFVATSGDIADGGETCPPAPSESIESPNGGGFITIPLNGVDTVIYVCSGGEIVGRCIHVFSSSSVSMFGGEFLPASKQTLCRNPVSLTCHASPLSEPCKL